MSLARGSRVTAASAASGHQALLPLVAPGSGPLVLESASPPDAFARVVLEPV